MTDWVRACNPAAPIEIAEQARAAARASAIAIGIGFLWALWGVYFMMTQGQAIMDAALQQAAAESSDPRTVEAMRGFAGGAAIGGAVLGLVFHAVLGGVQWFKPNLVIPILFVVLIVYGLGTALLGIAQGGPAMALVPAWQTWLGVVVLVVELVLHIAGIRGASALSKFRRVDAETF